MSKLPRGKNVAKLSSRSRHQTAEAADVLFRWKIDATSLGFTDVVNRAVVPALKNPKIVTKVSAYYVSKHDDDPNPARPTVWLVLFAPPGGEKGLRKTVDKHLVGYRVVEFCISYEDAMLPAAAAPYRSRLRAVVDVALELHASLQRPAHRAFVEGVYQRHGETVAGEPELRPYVRRNSGQYRAINPTPVDEDAFWREGFAIGPSGLSHPVHWVFNLIRPA